MYSYDKFNKTGVEFITCNPAATYNTCGGLYILMGSYSGSLYLCINPK